jgi:hypothetical protein
MPSSAPCSSNDPHATLFVRIVKFFDWIKIPGCGPGIDLYLQKGMLGYAVHFSLTCNITVIPHELFSVAGHLVACEHSDRR